MNLTIAETFRQKQNRRRVLSRLSIREKVEIIEQLRDLAVTMRRARQVHQNPGRIVCFPAKTSAQRFQQMKPVSVPTCFDLSMVDLEPPLAA